MKPDQTNPLAATQGLGSKASPGHPGSAPDAVQGVTPPPALTSPPTAARFQGVASPPVAAPRPVATPPPVAGPPLAATPPTSAAPPPDHELVGQMVGEYQVTGTLGEGGMGTVLSGIHPLISKKVAIKVLRPELSDNEDVMGRFMAEAKAVNAIGHPNIVDIFAFGTLPGGAQYMVMEYLDGIPLTTFLKEQSQISYQDAALIMKHTLLALEAAHEKGIIHRDLKPDNIFLIRLPDGEYQVKLLDFGIAKFTEDGYKTSQTQTGVPLGTPYYMGPEQCEGAGVDHRADIYSLGIILYEMFTGRVPFRGNAIAALIVSHVAELPVPPRELADLSEALERIILWCLEKDKEARPGSIRELRRALLPVLEQSAQADGQFSRSILAADSEPEGSRVSLSSMLSSLPRGRTDTRPKRLGQSMVVGLIAVIAVLLVGGYLYLRSTEGTPGAAGTGSPAAGKPSARVTIRLEVDPPDATFQIYVDDERRPSSRLQLGHSETKQVSIQVVARGFSTWKRTVLPDRNRVLRVKLVRTPSAPRPVMRPAAGEGNRSGMMRTRPGMSRTPPRPRPVPRVRPRERPRPRRPMVTSDDPTRIL